MISTQIFRLMHTNGLLRQVTNKSLLAKLRKKGYTFVNCKKEQVQHYGWTKTDKLKGCNTTQGLITVMVDGHYAALAEVNCKTNFVACNKNFRGLAETVVSAVLNHAKSQETKNEVQRTNFHADNLKDLLAVDGKRLSDHCALAIGNMGENIYLRRALALSVKSPDVSLFGCTYLAPMNPIPVSFGECGALVAIKCKESNPLLGKLLCEHIIFMDPQKIGNLLDDRQHNNVDEEQCMIYQECLFNPSNDVLWALYMNDAEIVDFARFEIGEELDEEPTLKSTQICG